MHRLFLVFFLFVLAPAATAGEPVVRGVFTDPESTSARAAARLEGDARTDALLLARFPSAAWFSFGSPDVVEKEVRAFIDRSAAAGPEVPVLVAYNIPFRDCALYSAGGAADGSAYLEWIRGFAAGEVRFDGVEGSRIDATYSSVDFIFSASPNATSIPVGGITVAAKKGWDYLWVLYEETTSEDRLVKVPVAAYVEQVYRYAAFSGLGL